MRRNVSFNSTAVDQANSTSEYKIGNTTYIVELTNIEHEIVKFNRRGKRVTADVTIYGEKHRVVFSIELDAPPALP